MEIMETSTYKLSFIVCYYGGCSAKYVRIRKFKRVSVSILAVK